MGSDAVVLVGGPESGKTNYLARLWVAISGGDGLVEPPELPPNIEYVEEALAHLLRGEFAGRTGKDQQREQSLTVAIRPRGRVESTHLVVPDVSGELWDEAVESYNIPDNWQRRLEESVGALLFIRVWSPQHLRPLNWVTDRALMLAGAGAGMSSEMPTDVRLCELARFLEHSLGVAVGCRRPRVAVLVTAWDLLHEQDASGGPLAYLRQEFPLLAGRIADSARVGRIDIAAFGVSVVGGDFEDEAFKEEFLKERSIEQRGYVVRDSGARDRELIAPVIWVLSGDD